MSEHFAQFLQTLLEHLNYFNIGLLMALESSIFPVPSELVMIPAGYLAHMGKLNAWLVTLVASLGSLTGSLVSYYLALELGRPLILRYGKYVLITQPHLDKTQAFVARHGEVSIFTGRFIPVIRHLISLPAGLVRMRLPAFVIYTALGSTLWNTVLLVLGLVIGENQAWLKQNLPLVTASAVGFAVVVVVCYILWNQRRKPAV